MTNTKSSGKLLLDSLILVLLLFGLVEIVVKSHGPFMNLEFAGLLLLMLLSFLGLVGYKSYGENVLFMVFLFYVVNLILIWQFYGTLYLVLLILSLVGFLMSFPKNRTKKVQDFTNPITNEPASMVFDDTPKVEIIHEDPKEVQKEEAKKEIKPKVKHSPGKYVASQRSNIYHEPKCDWAKKIKKDRQVWFEEKKDAQKKGYRKHSCVN